MAQQQDKKPAQIFHFDLYGKRDEKYNFLNENSISDIDWNELNPQEPNYFFVNKNFDEQKGYDEGFAVNRLFTLNSVGIVTAREDISITFDKKHLENIIFDFKSLESETIRRKYHIAEDTRDWKVSFAVKDLQQNNGSFTKIACRPFDIRFTYYTGNTKGFYSYPRNEIMSNFINKNNCGLVVSKQASQGFKHVFVTNTICNLNLTGTAGKLGAGYTMPLYIYPETNGQLTTDLKLERVPNLNQEIVNKIAETLGLTFVAEKEENSAPNNSNFAPIDILDYIYAVLHAPNYREKYKEFLKIDFPKIPYPKDLSTFQKLTNLGSQIRQIHLLESPKVDDFITEFNIDGDCVVGKIHFEKISETHGKVYLNYDKTPLSGAGGLQNFENVPEVAWNFYIGGYQPAQKWLKDRKGRKLEFDDIAHYQKIIVALTETDRLMKEIDKIEIE